MIPDHLLYQDNQTQIRQRSVECENRGGWALGEKDRMTDRPPRHSPSESAGQPRCNRQTCRRTRTMISAILLVFCDREINQKRRIVTSISTRRTGDDGRLEYSLDRSRVKRIPRLRCRDYIIASTVPQLIRASCTCLHRHSATTGLSSFLCTQAIWAQILLLIRLTRALGPHPSDSAYLLCSLCHRRFKARWKNESAIDP
jgi:hypothetical protein